MSEATGCARHGLMDCEECFLEVCAPEALGGTDESVEASKQRTGRLQLMDSGVASAPRMRADLQSTVSDVARFSLPVWIDGQGRARIALPVDDPQHAADMLQLIVSVDELLTVVGRALAEKSERHQ